MAESQEVPDFVGNGLIEFIGREFEIGRCADPILKLTVHEDERPGQVSGYGIQSTPARESDDPWRQSKPRHDLAIAIEHDRVLRCGFARTHYIVELRNGSDIGAGDVRAG